MYRELAEEFPEDFELIECAPNGVLLSIEEIHETLWERVNALIQGKE